MTISQGDTLPAVNLMRMGESGPEPVPLVEKFDGRKIAVFGLPGAYTSTCSSAHLPSVIRNMEKFREKGVEEVICVIVNDPFVAQAWATSSGATAAGITLLADPQSEFTKALGLDFSTPEVGLLNRSRRYALVAENGKVSLLFVEEEPGICNVSGAESLLDAM
ncbi:MAG: peroxiredoxin [Aestuariivita sp.]|nr:peroxiredoxin [Aestuariivita sp.]MCY4203757.1 peroxiredoxin [Aestuariivita sp.]MCY4287066.1 peroxiredoxin [Aestuariivita sp.]MCY4345475.1 peroxiredoxin [Aestuariivita sp.]